MAVRTWAVGLCMLLPLLAFAAGMVWLWWMVLRKPRAGAATCGRCGYRVEGLTTMNCPECGADFRQVGIRTPRPRKMLGPVAFTASWLLLLTPVALVASVILMSLAPQTIASRMDMTLEPVMPGVPMPRMQIFIAIDGPIGGASTSSSSTMTNGVISSTSTISFGPSGPPGVIVLSMYAPTRNPAPTFEIDSATGSFTYVAQNGQRVTGNGITADDLTSWFISTGILTPQQSNDDDTHQAVAELADALRALTNGQTSVTLSQLEFVGTTSTGRMSPARWAGPTLIGLWAAVFLIGVAVYVLVRRRRRAAGELDEFAVPHAGHAGASK